MVGRRGPNPALKSADDAGHAVPLVRQSKRYDILDKSLPYGEIHGVKPYIVEEGKPPALYSQGPIDRQRLYGADMRRIYRAGEEDALPPRARSQAEPQPIEQAAKNAPGAMKVMDKQKRAWVLGTQGRVHVLMAAHSMAPIDKVYASVFEGILGERISTQPVEIVNPFPWHGRKGEK